MRQIAAEYGVSHTAIGKKASAHGWARPDKNSAEPIKNNAEKKKREAFAAKDSLLLKEKNEEPGKPQGKVALPSGRLVMARACVASARPMACRTLPL